jgi:antitoxin ParD1/3/4
MNFSVTLPDDVAEFVTAKISTGDYRSTSDLVSEALRRMEQAEREPAVDDVERLREAWREGIASAIVGPFDVEALKRQARADRTTPAR